MVKVNSCAVLVVADESDDYNQKKEHVKRIVTRMCQAYELEGKDLRGQLARRLGNCLTGTVKGWVYNARVPYDAMVKCKEDVGCSLDWLLTGELPLREYEPKVVDRTHAMIKEHLSNSLRYQLLLTESGISTVAENIISDLELNLNVKFSK